VALSLSKKPQGTRVSTSEIGREMLIPPALLQRIVAELANGGFIKTQAGRDGGISLARLPSQITLLQIVEHFEGTLVISDCILKQGACPFEEKCPVSCQWKRINDMIRDEMSRINFQQLVEDGIRLEAALMPSASIALEVVPAARAVPLADNASA
jgi:Rrf2 family protein